MAGKRQRKPLVKPVRRKPEPVTTGKLPMFGCSLCKQKIYFDPRRTTAQKVMAKHYQEQHAGSEAGIIAGFLAGIRLERDRQEKP